MPSPHHLYTDHARPPCAGNAALLRGFASGPDDNMHDDFKPQFKGEKSDSVEQAIREDVSSNKVLLYMKVLPAMGVHPTCSDGTASEGLLMRSAVAAAKT